MILSETYYLIFYLCFNNLISFRFFIVFSTFIIDSKLTLLFQYTYINRCIVSALSFTSLAYYSLSPYLGEFQTGLTKQKLQHWRCSFGAFYMLEVYSFLSNSYLFKNLQDKTKLSLSREHLVLIVLIIILLEKE